MVGYTAFTLAMMAQFGRDAWRRDGETFHVWFGLLGRIAPYGPTDDPADDRIARRPFASALLLPGWHFEDLVLVALGTASILFDGLSQTQPWFDVFGAPGVPIKTLQLFGFLGVIVAGARHRVAAGRPQPDRRRPAADRGRATSSPTTSRTS